MDIKLHVSQFSGLQRAIQITLNEVTDCLQAVLAQAACTCERKRQSSMHCSTSLIPTSAHIMHCKNLCKCALPARKIDGDFRHRLQQGDVSRDKKSGGAACDAGLVVQ